nr:uncharacterized protein LOC123758713 [Procambarus clarkii]XP_045599249.1 uncharacterized protein LOC123758713 [Procambarus clarkii]
MEEEEEDQKPLLQTSSEPFVRHSKLRTTRRQRPPALLKASLKHTKSAPQSTSSLVSPAVPRPCPLGESALQDRLLGPPLLQGRQLGGSALQDGQLGGRAVQDRQVGGRAVQDQQLGGSAVQDQHLGGRAVQDQQLGGPAMQDRPPLPPRNSEDTLHKINNEVRKTQSLCYRRETRGSIISADDDQRPLSPGCHLQKSSLVRKSRSFVYGNHHISPPTRNVSPSPFPHTDQSFSCPSVVGHTATQNSSRYNTHNNESWNQQRLTNLQAETSSAPRRKTSPSPTISSQSTSQASSQGDEPRKGFASFFRRAQSSSPRRKVTSPSEESQTDHESSKHSQENNSGSSSWSQTVIARLQGRCLSPSPHRAPSSPTTFRKINRSSEAPSISNFRRYGSLPIEKSNPLNKSSTHLPLERAADATPGHERLSRSSSVQQSPVISREGSEEKSRGVSPWGDGAYMPWPLKPYSERETRKKRPESTVGHITVQTVPDMNTRDDCWRRRAVPLSTSLPSSGILQEVQRSADLRDDDLPGSRSSLINRKRSQNSHQYSTIDAADDFKPLHRPNSFTTGVGSQAFLPTDAHTPHAGHTGGAAPTAASSHAPILRCNKTFTKQPSTGCTQRRDAEDPESSQSSSSSSSSDGRQVKPRGELRDNLRSIHESCEEGAGLTRTKSLYSWDSGSSVFECLPNRLGMVGNVSKEADLCSSHFSYLLVNENEYLKCLQNMLSTYKMMCETTPPHIRQHFDVFFKQMEIIYHFQVELYDALKETNGDPTLLVQAFRNDQFHSYNRYMIMTPTVQKDFSRYSVYFEENFPDLKRNILKPSMRINFYVMMLEGFKKEASEKEKAELDSARDYLNQLKREANTIMTIATVFNSPVDLRLGGDVLQIGELLCLGGSSLQKKKYNVILFENLLVITSSKMEFFKYKVHYRAEQLEEVEAVGESEFILHALTEGQCQRLTMKFKAKSTFLRDEWIKELQKIVLQNEPSVHRENPQTDIFSMQAQSQMFPLNIFTEYPHLMSALTQEDSVNPTPVSIEESCLQLIYQEKAYVRHLSSLLNPDTIMPPVRLCSLLEKLYQLHGKLFLPCLERSRFAHDILRGFLENIDSFSVYIDYLVVRSQMVTQLDTSTDSRLYISPVQHLTFYVIWLRQICLSSALRESAQQTLDHIKNYVRKAQIRLLTDAIINGRVDFYRSGNIIRHDKMDVKTRKKEVRGGLYFALLFEKIIILTKPKPPFYEYTWDIWLDQVNLGPPTTSDVAFKLEVRQGGGRDPVTYEFRANTPAIKRAWLQGVQKQMLQQAEKIRRRTSTDF